MRSVSVQKELMKCEECEHSKQFKVKEELVEKKEVTVQTETELKKCNDCGFCTDDLNEL